MNYLGLDVSLNNTGYAIYSSTEDKILEVGHISNKAFKSNEQSKKLDNLNKKIVLLCTLYNFEKVFIEEPYIGFSGATMKLIKALNVIYCTLGKSYELCDIVDIHNKTIKKAITGNGNNKKEAVAQYILKRFPDLQFKNNDESDAVAVVLTGVQLISQEGDFR